MTPDIIAKCRANRDRAAERIRSLHAAECSTWEPYSIPARTPEGRPTTMTGEGCRQHRIFISA